MTQHSPFDHTPDPVYGDALRDALAVSDDPGFVRQVLERIRAPEPWWEILGDWARPSVAAALLVTVAGAFLLGWLVGPQPAGRAGDPGPGIGLEVTALLTEDGPPDVESILGDGSQ